MDVRSLTPERLRELLDGEPSAVTRLIAALAPHVRLRVTRVLRRSGLRRGRDTLDSEIDDLCQETLLELFGNDARALRTWDPTRGLPLSSFTQMIAERVALSRLRHWRRGVPTLLEEPEDVCCAVDSVEAPDHCVASRKRFECMLEKLEMELTPRGLEIFRALFVECRPTAAVCEDFALNPDAVYAWRSRLGKRVRAILDDLEPRSERCLARPRSS